MGYKKDNKIRYVVAKHIHSGWHPYRQYRYPRVPPPIPPVKPDIPPVVHPGKPVEDASSDEWLHSCSFLASGNTVFPFCVYQHSLASIGKNWNNSSLFCSFLFRSATTNLSIGHPCTAPDPCLSDYQLVEEETRFIRSSPHGMTSACTWRLKNIIVSAHLGKTEKIY
jgi:hypothetical protein